MKEAAQKGKGAGGWIVAGVCSGIALGMATMWLLGRKPKKLVTQPRESLQEILDICEQTVTNLENRFAS